MKRYRISDRTYIVGNDATPFHPSPIPSTAMQSSSPQKQIPSNMILHKRISILHKRIYSAVVIIACMLSVGGASAHAESPNIILILADDQGWSQLSEPMDPRVPNASSDYL
jgi:hypothetical protein